jgi:hypothetical protein
MRHREHRWLRGILSCLGACILLAMPAQAETDWEQMGAESFDVLLLRPLGTIGTVSGFAMFLPIALLTSPGGKDSINEAWALFVREPSDATFRRPLGEF